MIGEMFPLAAETMNASVLGSIIGGFLVVTIGLVETIKYFISKRNGTTKPQIVEIEKPVPILTSNERTALFETHQCVGNIEKLTAKTDDDGVPMIYMPRGFAKEMVATQKQIAKTMDKMAVLMDRWDRGHEDKER